MADQPTILPPCDPNDGDDLTAWLRACEQTGAKTAEHIRSSVAQIHATLYAYARSRGLDHDAATKAAALVTDPINRAADEMDTFAGELQHAVHVLKTQTDLDGDLDAEDEQPALPAGTASTAPPALPAGGTIEPAAAAGDAEHAFAAAAPVGDVAPGGWYVDADGDAPYLDWSSRHQLGSGRNVELGDGTDAVCVSVTADELEQLREGLARATAGEPDPDAAVELEDGGYLDYSVRTPDGGVMLEVGNGEDAVAVAFTGGQLRGIHAQFDQDLTVAAAEVGVYFPAPAGADDEADGPYLDWSTRHDDGNRQLDIGNDVTGTAMDMTPGDLLDLRTALAGTLSRPDPAPAGAGEWVDNTADTFYPRGEHNAVLDWSQVLPDGRRRLQAETPDGKVVDLDLDRGQLQQIHDALSIRIAADRAAAADPMYQHERVGETALAAVSARLPDRPENERLDTTSQLDLDADPGWRPETTAAVERALRLYRCSTFRRVNQYLRGADEAETSFTIREAPGAEPTHESVYVHVALIDSAMEASPLHVPVQVWRGLHDTARALGDTWRDGADMVGAEWTEPRYQSTSADPGVALGFGDDVLLRLHVPAGIGAIQLSSWRNARQHTREAELLLDRELRMRVIADQVEPIPGTGGGATFVGDEVRTLPPTTRRILDVEVRPALDEDETETQFSPPAEAGVGAAA
ncbi:ADP-ribosyltransferase [Dactylosporangium sp. CA-152071]|uniref:ADP-ribosyltransferase n=1 Tax=Dactylosporangium sp. CA-152071 TaxID=3239933 RepID=UPI003D9351E7